MGSDPRQRPDGSGDAPGGMTAEDGLWEHGYHGEIQDLAGGGNAPGLCVSGAF